MKWLLLLLLLPAVLLTLALLLNAPAWMTPPGPLERVRTWLGENRVATRPDHVWPELRSLNLPLTLPQARQRVIAAIRTLGWHPEQSDESQLHAVVTTALWRFRDDVRIQLTAEGESQVRVDVIAQSRVGKGDLAANSRHVVDLYRTLNSQETNNE